MLVALPAERISGLGGFMTAVDFLARRLGMGVLVVPIAVLVAVSNVGAASAYLSSTARLPFVAGVHRYLPAAFGRIHPRFGTPYVAIIFVRRGGNSIRPPGAGGREHPRRLRHVGQHGRHHILHSLSFSVCFGDSTAGGAAAGGVVSRARWKANHYSACLCWTAFDGLHDCAFALSGGG